MLEQEPDNPEANANLGWILYLSSPAEAGPASDLIERSLAAAPGYAQAMFYLANVRLYGLDDPIGAKEILDQLRSADDLPGDVAARIEEMLAEADADTKP